MHAIQQVLADVNGNTIVSIDTLTAPALPAKSEYKGRLFKAGVGHNVMVFTNKRTNGYEAMVNRRLVTEGIDPATFTVGPRQWGNRIEGTPFVTHNGELYLEVVFLRAGAVHYYLDGAEISEERAHECGVKEPRDYGGQGGLKNKVVIRTFKLSNITQVTVNGSTHVM